MEMGLIHLIYTQQSGQKEEREVLLWKFGYKVGGAK